MCSLYRVCTGGWGSNTYIGLRLSPENPDREKPVVLRGTRVHMRVRMRVHMRVRMRLLRCVCVDACARRRACAACAVKPHRPHTAKMEKMKRAKKEENKNFRAPGA